MRCSAPFRPPGVCYDPTGAARLQSGSAQRIRVSMIEMPIGILLAGGRASRMGGGDKCLKEVGGLTLLAHVVDRLAPQCALLILSANGTAERFADFALPVCGDDVPDFAGPLAGILAGLDFAAARDPAMSWALSAPADTPFLPDDLVARLDAARRSQGAVLASARSGRTAHSAVALWPVSLRHDLRHALVDGGIRKVSAFLSRYRLAYADWDVEPFDPFFNVNTAEDLLAAETIWAGIKPKVPDQN
jgi:molybdenum cofactor guanylyltransferase